MTSFEGLGLRPEILQALGEMGFEKPTEIQEQAIPAVIHENRDVVGLASTGTGKTAAFGLPLLHLLEPKGRPQALVMSPTRELCLQIARELENFAKFLPKLRVTAVYGGANIVKQRRELQSGTDIIVATPGRLMDLMNRGDAKLDQIEYAVLDEADEMLNMGFLDDIREILSKANPDRRTLLFSATMPDAIRRISREFMQDPIQIQIGKRNQATTSVEHSYYLTTRDLRYASLRRLLDSAPNIYGIVFCNTKMDTQEVAENLIKDGYTAASLHGDLSQQQRDMVMQGFRSRHVRILVATDVAARGIDVDDVTHVIHHRLPDDVENYNHRSGRTGRAGKSGISWILATKKEATKIPYIQKIIGRTIHKQMFPTGAEVCNLQLKAFAQRVASKEGDVEVVRPYLEDMMPLFENMDKEMLIASFLAEEFEGLFRHYAQVQDLNSGTEDTPRRENRYFINLGTKDGFSWMLLKDWLRDQTGVGKFDIQGVETQATHSYFSVKIEIAEKVEQALASAVWNEREVRIELVANARSERGGGGGGFRGGSGGRSRGGDRPGPKRFGRSGGGGPREGHGGGGGNFRPRREGGSRPRRDRN